MVIKDQNMIYLYYGIWNNIKMVMNCKFVNIFGGKIYVDFYVRECSIKVVC